MELNKLLLKLSGCYDISLILGNTSSVKKETFIVKILLIIQNNTNSGIEFQTHCEICTSFNISSRYDIAAESF